MVTFYNAEVMKNSCPPQIELIETVGLNSTSGNLV